MQAEMHQYSMSKPKQTTSTNAGMFNLIRSLLNTLCAWFRQVSYQTKADSSIHNFLQYEKKNEGISSSDDFINCKQNTLPHMKT